MITTGKIGEFLIVSVTPQNLERGVLWFGENLERIKKARHTNPWWRKNILLIEKDLAIKPYDLARRLSELGYERTQSVAGKGLFAVRGGIIEVWPINCAKPFLIEFRGNAIEQIREREQTKELIKPRPARGEQIEKLPTGSFVVHIDHGIGILRGQEKRHDHSLYFIIEYAAPATGHEPDRLYVPLDQKDRLAPYVGFETPRVHRLGGTIWFTTKKKAREQAEKLAKELLGLYAKRHSAQRQAYNGDTAIEQMVRDSFGFVETPDQIRAEQEIMHDLESSQPMDRVLCGDVGFGKTEMAIRAAIRVITSGKQVALLAPTTILAAQHFKTFSERLGDLPIKIRMLSRLAPPREQKQTLQALADGHADLVIGTHRLLSKKTQFKNLGLVIIDEEQRFGVKQKEHFKEMRAEVDILSLSATPIPRTLHLSLARLRDISRIDSPPPERIPIQTFVLPYSPRIIREAIGRELERNGQVYFLHNRIETMAHLKDKLEAMLKKSNVRGHSIGLLHGRMPEYQIIRVMQRFRSGEINPAPSPQDITRLREELKPIHPSLKSAGNSGRSWINILIATTIIENGLDISSANTLIVDDASRLGLSEAHQLRGRIGRGSTQAYAYFLYQPQRMTEKGSERLTALQEFAELGSGYQLALRDLEIRGAGNILGREQSGAVNKVGLNLYYQMLAEAVEEIKQ